MKLPLISSLKIIDRYILKETISPFISGIGIFLSIFLIDIFMELTNMVINKGVDFWDVAKYFIYSLPALIVLVFPMGILLGVVIALGRLSSDSEITALKASGINFFRIISPLIILSVILSSISFITNEFIVPITNRKRSKLQRQILLKKPIPQIIEKEFKSSNKERAIYIDRNKKGSLYDIIMLEFRDNQFPLILYSKSGSFSGDMFEFKNGIWYVINKIANLKSTIKFQKMIRPINTEIAKYHESAKSARELSFYELRKKIKEYNKMGLSVNNLVYELYMKTSLPMACFVFVLLGAPLAFIPNRSSKAIGTGLSIVIIFFYYILLSAGKALYLAKIINPILAAWLPNIIIIIIGGILVWRARH